MRLPAVFIALGAVVAWAAPAAPAQTTGGSIVAGAPLDPTLPAFRTPSPGPAQPRLTRDLPIAKGQSGRTQRRRSFSYFAALTDFQLADEESPARVEQFDTQFGQFSWRPYEAVMPAIIDQTARKIGALSAASPVAQAGGLRAPLDFTLVTGDEADNQQLNEVLWVRQLLEGGTTLNPNSGTSDYSTCSVIDAASLGGRPANEAERYTGVQDYDDYNAGSGSPLFYDPNTPSGTFSGFPRWSGLMDRAQLPFTPAGLRRANGQLIPSYVAHGNHDLAVQGNDVADKRAEEIATGCFKPFASSVTAGGLPRTVFRQSEGFAVPPDPGRRFVDRVEIKRVYGAGEQPDAHGFGLVDPTENQASGFTAGYYSFSPKPGLRLIALDTVAEGGAAVGSAQGNLDNPQFAWLSREIAAARAQGQLVVVYGHHPIRSMTQVTPDEQAPACTGSYESPSGAYTGTKDSHGHDDNPGCDLDPRDSSPVHPGGDLAALFDANPHVIAYVTGHVHLNRVLPCGALRGCPRTGNWWEIATASAADWPQQQRLIELMDNADGTVSLMTTMVDHGAPLAPPPNGAPGGNFGTAELAAAGRALAMNDPQVSLASSGTARDRNLELIVRDPRQGTGAGLCARIGKVPAGKRLDRVKLGLSRSAIRKAYPKTALKKSTYVDGFCLIGGGKVRARVPAPGLLKGLSKREARRVRNRAVMLLSSRKLDVNINRIAIGAHASAVKRRLRGERSYRVGSTRWYLAKGNGARVIVATKRGKVTEIGLADLKLTATKKRAKAFLAGFR